MRPFRFGVQASPFGDSSTLAEFAQRVEALGYDELFSYDHVGSDSTDPFVPLVVAALATTRLRVGPLVLNNEFHHPALIARTAAALDRVSDGRLVLGMGSGYSQAEHDAIGLPLRPPAPRVRRLDESLVVIRSLLDTGACDFDGEFHRLAVEEIGVRPVQPRVPFLVGGHGPQMVSLAARHADVFQFAGLTHGDGGEPAPGGFSTDSLRQRSDWLAEAAGPRNAEIERSAIVQTTSVAGRGPTVDEIADAIGVAPDVVAESPFALVGTVDEIVDELLRHRDELAISHWVIRDPEGFAPVVERLAGR